MDNETTTPTLYFTETSEDGELYCKYSAQTSPQPVNLCLDLDDGQLSCYYSSGIGAVSTERAFHKRDLEWRIPPLRVEAVRDLYQKAAPACQVILEGASVGWDGYNWVGMLTPEAQDAYEKVESLIEDLERGWTEADIWDVWEASMWYDPCSNAFEVLEHVGLSSEATDEEIEKAAQTEVQNAEVPLDVDDVEKFILSMRESALEILEEAAMEEDEEEDE